jgi:hypothetical protein
LVAQLQFHERLVVTLALLQRVLVVQLVQVQVLQVQLAQVQQAQAQAQLLVVVP